MLDGFEAAAVPTGETEVFVRRGGSGLPVLLLHGFPETHLMWRGVAPLLARRGFTVVCADLRGYGRSGCPASAPDHAPYAKRAMARDMVAAMERLGFPRFSVAGHDRGGRVAYRMALDHPERVDRLAVLDVVPTAEAWDRADARFALAFWPWSFLAQPEPLPERVLAAVPEAVVDNAPRRSAGRRPARSARASRRATSGTRWPGTACRPRRGPARRWRGWPPPAGRLRQRRPSPGPAPS